MLCNLLMQAAATESPDTTSENAPESADSQDAEASETTANHNESSAASKFVFLQVFGSIGLFWQKKIELGLLTGFGLLGEESVMKKFKLKSSDLNQNHNAGGPGSDMNVNNSDESESLPSLTSLSTSFTTMCTGRICSLVSGMFINVAELPIVGPLLEPLCRYIVEDKMLMLVVTTGILQITTAVGLIVFVVPRLKGVRGEAGVGGDAGASGSDETESEGQRRGKRKKEQ
jgi:hypothetical protein